MKSVETVIIGGGVAGLACARALHRADQEFCLISDRLGGRMYQSADGINFGAAYLTSDYRHVLQFADKAERVYLKDIYFFDGSRYITVLSPINFKRTRPLARLYQLVLAFRRRLNRLRVSAAHTCQKALLHSDPVLRAYVEQSAIDLVRQHCLEEVTEIYCGPMFYSTLFVPWTEANAFYFLANLFPIWLAVYTADLSATVERLSADYRDRIVRDKVVAVEREGQEGPFVVEAGEGRWRANQLVVAVPNRNAEAFFPLEGKPHDIPYCTLHVRGTRRSEYMPGKTVFLRAEHPVRVLWPQRNGIDIIFSPEPEPDLSAYYSDYEVVAAAAWKTAVQLNFGAFRPLQPSPNLFTIGDYNICGLEDSYVTGLFAANRIIAAARS